MSLFVCKYCVFVRKYGIMSEPVCLSRPPLGDEAVGHGNIRVMSVGHAQVEQASQVIHPKIFVCV